MGVCTTHLISRKGGRFEKQFCSLGEFTKMEFNKENP
jgi:hypothetical protein